MTAIGQPSDASFRIACLFHQNAELLALTFPRCVEALTGSTAESYEVLLHCDGTPEPMLDEVARREEFSAADEIRFRRRYRFVANGDASNNGHRRLFGGRSRYLIVFEDDVVMYRSDPHFDVLAACRALFERYADVAVICKLDDYDVWAWCLTDVGEQLEPGVRSVNRVATHFIAYDLHRFLPAAQRFGAFELDVFIDRDDLSYNWEDLVSHVGTTGGRRIAFPEAWPLHVFHCDRKIADGSMYNSQNPLIKRAVFDDLEARFGQGGRS